MYNLTMEETQIPQPDHLNVSKKMSVTLILLMFLVPVLLGTNAYLYYQNMQLKQTIKDLTPEVTDQKEVEETVMAPKEVADLYLKAYIEGDWETVAKLGSFENTEENRKIAEGYQFTGYEILEDSPRENKNYHDVFITLTDATGNVYKTAKGEPLEVLMYKTNNGNWKALTWYFFP